MAWDDYYFGNYWEDEHDASDCYSYGGQINEIDTFSLVRETEKGLLVSDKEQKKGFWLPKSQIKYKISNETVEVSNIPYFVRKNIKLIELTPCFTCT